jgi:hypothetical protein
MKQTLKYLVILCALNLYAQDKLEYGIEFGINYGKSNIVGDDTEGIGFSAEFGFNGGIYLVYELSEKLGIKTNISYNRTKSSFVLSSENGSLFPVSDGFGVQSIFGDTERNTISIPLLISLFRDKKVMLDIGPSFEYTLNSEINYEQSVINKYVDENIREENEFGLSTKLGIMLIEKLFLNIKYLYLTKTESSLGFLSLSYSI